MVCSIVLNVRRSSLDSILSNVLSTQICEFLLDGIGHQLETPLGLAGRLTSNPYVKFPRLCFMGLVHGPKSQHVSSYLE